VLCVQGTPVARLHPDLQLPPQTMIVTKGTDRHDDGYSAMEGRVAGRETLLEDLATRGVTHLYVGGLATDYCVKQSVLDALAQGVRVTVLEDAIAAVNVTPDDGQRAIEQMKAAGATFEPSSALVDAESTQR
jgi:nicotinamidase/pyrazinamidase